MPTGKQTAARRRRLWVALAKGAGGRAQSVLRAALIALRGVETAACGLPAPLF